MNNNNNKNQSQAVWISLQNLFKQTTKKASAKQ